MKNSIQTSGTMSSREMAEVAGRNHKDLLRSIRKMEIPWSKVSGRSFTLVEYIDQKGEKRPEYQLTKSEALFIATKFNDVARAKLILRWEQLEHERALGKFPELEELNEQGTVYYQYTEVIKALGYSTISGYVYQRCKRYPQFFLRKFGLWFVASDFVHYMQRQRRHMLQIEQLRLEFGQ